jgi:hypothetical protein
MHIHHRRTYSSTASTSTEHDRVSTRSAWRGLDLSMGWYAAQKSAAGPTIAVATLLRTGSHTVQLNKAYSRASTHHLVASIGSYTMQPTR